MNLYLISQTEKDDYDTFDAAVVAAPNADDARNIHPGYEDGRLVNWDGNLCEWCSALEHVSAVLIGVAPVGTPKGVILASFNAG